MPAIKLGKSKPSCLGVFLFVALTIFRASALTNSHISVETDNNVDKPNDDLLLWEEEFIQVTPALPVESHLRQFKKRTVKLEKMPEEDDEDEPQGSGVEPEIEQSDETNSNETAGVEQLTNLTNEEDDEDITDELALILGIAGLVFIGSWLIVGPAVCCTLQMVRSARRRRERRQNPAASPQPATSSTWFSRWGRASQSQRPILLATTAAPGHAADDVLLVGGDRPTITITQPYTPQAMTTFSQQQPLLPRATVRTDI